MSEFSAPSRRMFTESCSGHMPRNVTCGCHASFNCSRVLGSLDPAVAPAHVCADASVAQAECVHSCSQESFVLCEDLFEDCVEALGEQGTCECLGRLRMCSVDAGCKALSALLVMPMFTCSSSQG